ncbi:MAG: nuclear transport factor 2 family protein [Bacteroidota bacterium]
MTAVALVQAFYAHLANGDKARAYTLLDEHFTLKQADALPYGGEYKGREALGDFFEKFNRYWQEFKTVTTDFYEVGNKVFAVSSIRGVNYQNRLIETEMIQIYVIENHLIVSAQPFYFDTALMQEI